MENAERNVLGAALMDKRAAALCTTLKEGDFLSERHRLIFSAIKRLHAKGEEIDPLTVNNAMGKDGATAGGIQYLTELLLDTISASNIERHIEIVREQSQRRGFIAGMGKVLASAAAGEDYLPEARRALDNAVNHSAAGIKQISEDIPPALEYLYSDTSALKTGYFMLDSVLGGLKAGQLILLAGTTRSGKTAFALNIALNTASAGRRVLIFSLEMAKHELIQRLITIESGINFYEQFRDKSLVEKYLSAADALKQYPIYIDDKGGVTLEHIRSQCYGVSPEFIIIDYLGLMQTERRNTREQEVSMLTHSLKAFAKEMNCPLLLLCQLNRRADYREGGAPRLSDLRESGAIEQDSDIVLLLHRPALTNKSADKSECVVDIAKNRNGMPGKIELRWDGPHFRFKDAETAEKTPFDE